jgi:hypothetical protein
VTRPSTSCPLATTWSRALSRKPPCLLAGFQGCSTCASTTMGSRSTRTTPISLRRRSILQSLPTYPFVLPLLSSSKTLAHWMNTTSTWPRSSRPNAWLPIFGLFRTARLPFARCQLPYHQARAVLARHIGGTGAGKRKQGHCHKYRLLFGRTIEVVDPADPTTKLPKIRLAELTPVFLQVLKTSKTMAAV